MPKAEGKKKAVQLRHAPLSTELEQAERPALSNKHKMRGGREGEDFAEDEDVDDLHNAPAKSLNAKIFNQAREQRKEEVQASSSRSSGKASAGAKPLPLVNDSDDDYEDDINEESDNDGEEYVTMDSDSNYVHTAGLADGEEDVVARFLKAGRAETRTLADIIIEKLNESKRNNGDADMADGASAYDGPEALSLPPKVVEVYTAVGVMLGHYKSGKMPKALKMLPHLRNWEDVLWVTRPDSWSAQATFACTRIFASNLNERMSQRFFNMVLLEKVRDDIRTNNKLNYHLYAALSKALFKPASFYKGILLPLAQSGSCTLREATIIGSVLAKVLVNKKYSLPRRVLEGLVTHFTNFIRETRVLPVIWHQSLLVFAQRYKLQLTDDHRSAFKELLKIHSHHQITQEVRRELFNSANAAKENSGMQY